MRQDASDEVSREATYLLAMKKLTMDTTDVHGFYREPLREPSWARRGSKAAVSGVGDK